MEGQHQLCSRLGPATLAGALFHEAGDALLVIDPISERVLDANALAERLSEFSRDELVRLSLRSLVRHEQEWQDWLLSGGPSTPLPDSERFLLRTRQPDRWVPVSVAVSRLSLAEGETLVLCRLRDRREQLDAQRRLQRTEAELRRVMGCVSDGLYSARIEPDGTFRYRYLSPAMQRLTGRPLPMLLQEPRAREQAVHPDDLPLWRSFQSRVAAGQPGEAEYRLRRPDGSVVWARESVVLAPDEGGLLIHGTLTDVSDRKRAEEAARRVPAETARLDGLARLAGVIAHDLNNLITGVLGNVSLMRLAVAGELVGASLAQIESATNRVAELARFLTTVAGKGPAHAGISDLDALVQRLAGPARAALHPGQQLRVDLAGNLPAVAADEPSLAVLIEHLLNNARDALGDGAGEIVIRTSPDEPRRTSGEPADWLRYPGPIPAGPRACLEVRDSGPGLTDEARARLFEPFFSTRPGRRGVGLATVLGIVRGLKGSLEVWSRSGQGTAFRVLLPGGTVPAPSRVAAPPASGPEWRGEGAILLADDEGAVLDVVSRLLRSLGCRVLTAHTGDEVLECYRRHAAEVRVVLIDLVMPRRSGEQVLAELRQKAPELPVLVMSGHPEQEVVPRLAPLGLTGYLQKPFRLPALLEAVRPYLAVGEGKP